MCIFPDARWLPCIRRTKLACIGPNALSGLELMNLRLLSLAAAPALLLLAACSPGQSDAIPLESIEAIVDIGQEHGFETFEELEAESDREFVLKGWDDAQLRM